MSDGISRPKFAGGIIKILFYLKIVDLLFLTNHWVDWSCLLPLGLDTKTESSDPTELTVLYSHVKCCVWFKLKKKILVKILVKYSTVWIVSKSMFRNPSSASVHSALGPYHFKQKSQIFPEAYGYWMQMQLSWEGFHLSHSCTVVQ